MAISPAVRQDLEKQLGHWAAALDEHQLQWASGYLAGIAAARVEVLPARAQDAASDAAVPIVTIWYGSETGNGRGVAERLAADAKAQGFSVELASTADVKPRAIAKLDTLLLVMSTHGEGDPPDDAEALHKLVLSDRAPRLEKLKFAVFALGDSSYPDFCQTGQEFDRRLEELGATRLMDRVDVDVDFEPAEDVWRSELLATLSTEPKPGGIVPAPHLQLIRGAEADAATRFDRRRPFQAEVLQISPLTVAPSTSPVHHVELLVEGSGLEWLPGDSLGLWPTNDPRRVDEIIEVTGIDAGYSIRRGGETLPANEWLSRRLELTQLARPFLEAWAAVSDSAELRNLLGDREAFSGWVTSRQVIDVLRDYPARVEAAQLIDSMRGIAPRLYSIASSPLTGDDEIHLTVKRVGGLDQRARLRAGVASWQLTESVKPGDTASVYVEANPRFRLPDDPDAPVIMIGPGTGVAPFRAFVQHRQAAGANGPNWLFFGARNRRTDFLYQLEWQRFQREGALDRLSVAFSRDQAEKIYVQDRVREQGRDIYDWLERGAHVYVCGDGQAMAADVHQTLVEVIAAHGGKTEGQATDHLESMKHAKRYQKDVY